MMHSQSPNDPHARALPVKDCKRQLSWLLQKIH